MPNKPISNISILKGKILEYLIDETLSDLLFPLKMNGIDCYHIYSRVKGGQSRISIDFLLRINLDNVKYFFHIEAKNHDGDRMLNDDEFEERLLNKFLSEIHLGSINEDKHYNLVIGSVRLSKKCKSLSEIHKIDYLLTGELDHKSNEANLVEYQIKLKQELFSWLSSIIPTLFLNTVLSEYDR